MGFMVREQEVHLCPSSRVNGHMFAWQQRQRFRQTQSTAFSADAQQKVTHQPFFRLSITRAFVQRYRVDAGPFMRAEADMRTMVTFLGPVGDERGGARESDHWYGIVLAEGHGSSVRGLS